jgi:hypothetical protein
VGVLTQRPMADASIRARHRPGASARWPVIALGALVLLAVLVDVWWLERFRAGYPVNIDEADYIGFGLTLKSALAHGGPASLWHAWAAQTHFGPLLPLLSVPVLAVLGQGVISALVAQLLCLVALLVASYALGSALSTRWGGLLTALIVAGTPGIIDYSRTFEFAVTAAAVLTAATYFLIASQALTRRSWSLAWGISLGLLPLARTMTLAFLPGQVVIAAWLVLARPGPRRPRLVNGALALAVAVITAGTWFVKSWHAQLSYLTGFGYGAQSERYAGKASVLRIGYWTRELVSTVTADLYLPLAAAVLAAAIIGVAAVAVRERNRSGAPDWRRRVLELGSSNAAVVLFVVVEGYLAITSSRNEGVAFRTPLLPGLAALAVACLWRVPRTGLRTALAAVFAAIAIFNIAMKADLTGSLSGRTSVDVPGLGTTPVADGLGYIQAYTISALEARYGSPTHPLPASAKQWLPAYRSIDSAVLDNRPVLRGPPNLELTVDEPLVNAYALSFAAQLYRGSGLVANVLPGPSGPAGAATYRATLAKRESQGVNTLVSVDRLGFSYFAAAQARPEGQARFEEAAAGLGYVCVGAVLMPDGRKAFIQIRGRGPSIQPAAACRPRVRETVPGRDATGVSPAHGLAVVLDRPLATAVPSGAFRLIAGPHGTPVAGTVTELGDRALVFSPRRPLAPHTAFTATLQTVTASATGAHLAEPYRWRFTTR